VVRYPLVDFPPNIHGSSGSFQAFLIISGQKDEHQEA
jgi:hypothetical protein